MNHVMKTAKQWDQICDDQNHYKTIDLSRINNINQTSEMDFD